MDLYLDTKLKKDVLELKYLWGPVQVPCRDRSGSCSVVQKCLIWQYLHFGKAELAKVQIHVIVVFEAFEKEIWESFFFWFQNQ